MSHQPDHRRMLDDRGYSGPTIHNTNPAHLLEKTIRERILESYYWKEQCFGINEATLCDRAAALTSIGGTYGLSKPHPFLCLTLKLLQLLPSREIILEYLHQREFKYLTCLAAFYVRLTFGAVDVYGVLEPLLGDYRRIRRRRRDGGCILGWVDGFVDELLMKDRVCGTALRKLPARIVLEDLGALEGRVSGLGAEVDEIDSDDDSDDDDKDEDRHGRGMNGGGVKVEEESDSSG